MKHVTGLLQQQPAPTKGNAQEKQMYRDGTVWCQAHEVVKAHHFVLGDSHGTHATDTLATTNNNDSTISNER